MMQTYSQECSACAGHEPSSHSIDVLDDDGYQSHFFGGNECC
jgi:hypothetical protein